MAEQRRRRDLREGQVLIIHQGALGDLILSLPAMRVIRLKYPRHFIQAMGYPERLRLLEGRFYADRVISVERHGMARLYLEHGEFPHELVAFISQFDAIFVFGRAGQTIFAGNLRQIGRGEVVHSETFKEEKGGHVVDRQLTALTPLSAQKEDSVPRVFVNEEDRARAREFFEASGLGKRGEPVVALHLGSGDKKKNWPVKQFVELSRHAVLRHGLSLLVIVGPAETDAFEAYLKGVPDFKVAACRDRPIVDVAAMIERSNVFVGNDSGVSHLSAAVGTPTVALFGPTDHRVWGPRGPWVTILRSREACAPCSEDAFSTCSLGHCMQSIAPFRIVEAVLDSLALSGRERGKASFGTTPFKVT